MRVFVTNLHTTLGATIARHLQDADHEVLGSVPSKTNLALTKRKLLSHPRSDREDAVKDPITVITNKLTTTKLLNKAEVVIATGFAQDPKAAMELLKQFEKASTAAADDVDEDQEAAGVKRFIAISSILTWSKNAAFANAKDQRGHSEDDFKTRKPARRYAELKTAETQVLSANKADVFETCVVAAGLLYGGAQSSLTPLFRNAWMYPDRELLVPAVSGSAAATRGENLLPMVSVYDLALLASRLAAAPSVPKSYIFATDLPSQSTTLRDLCVGVSTLLGNGTIRDVLTEDEVDALLVSEDDADGVGSQSEGGSGLVAALQLHLCVDAASETSAMTSLVAMDEYQHVATGLLSNLAFYVEDFIASIDLRPLKTVVLGPPRVGKTMLSQRLAKEYYLPHLTIESIAAEVLATISTQENADDESVAAEAKPEDETAGGSNAMGAGDDKDPELQQLCVELQAWRATSTDDTKTASLDELPETTVVALLRWKLSSAVCRNQGFVLDGMPTSVDQAIRIFELINHGDNAENGADGGDADADAMGEPPTETANAENGADDQDDAEAKSKSLSKSRSKAILDKLRPKKQIQFPNRVVVLHAPQELLEQRAQALSDAEALATGNTQSRFTARHAIFTAEIEKLGTFFEQKSSGTRDGVEVVEIHLENEASYVDSSDVLYAPVKMYMEQGGGKPHNFHPTRDELKQLEHEYTRKKHDEEVRQQQLELDQEERDTTAHHARMDAERARLGIIHREEAELLETRAKPLRTYLMDTVLPALTEGMLEIVKVQPDDPIDYLAEFLFKKGRDLETNAS